MKKIKVSEASGAVLDWMVAKADGYDEGWLLRQLTNTNPSTRAIPAFSTDWSQGGPIIEREGIWVSDPSGDVLHPRQWGALLKGTMHDTRGPTPLIAAMRCFVASRFGDEVEVPEELL